MKVLVVDDDRDLVAMMTFALERAGYITLAASTAPDALRMLRESEPDLAVLDVNLGVWNGFDLLREIRKVSHLPVIMLTGRDEEDDKVRGLQLGADDYVTKPFSYRELVARIEARLRRDRPAVEVAGDGTREQYQVGPLTLDVPTHSVAKDGHPVKLTATEFKLLHCLMARAGRIVPTRELLKQVWGFDDPSGADLVRVTLYRLRRKLEDDPANPMLVRGVPGIGVIVAPPETSAAQLS